MFPNDFPEKGDQNVRVTAKQSCRNNAFKFKIANKSTKQNLDFISLLNEITEKNDSVWYFGNLLNYKDFAAFSSIAEFTIFSENASLAKKIKAEQNQKLKIFNDFEKFFEDIKSKNYVNIFVFD